MATKKTQDAAGVLTAGKKGNTKNMKVKATPNAGLLDGYRRLEEACASYEKKTQEAWANRDKQKLPWEDAEFWALFLTKSEIERAKDFCDFAIAQAYNSVRNLCE